jgi:ABC-2 type transport system permease protein
MLPIFRYALKRWRGQMIGWGLAMFLIGLMTAARYDLIVSSKKDFEGALKGQIGEVIKHLGLRNPKQMFEPEGFLTASYFSFLPLILGIFAIMGGSGLLAVDEENGTLDLIAAHPVSRTALFLGRLAAFGITIVSILFVSWLGLVVPMGYSSLSIDALDLTLPFLSLLAVLAVLATLALLLAMLLPSRRMAATTGGLVLVADFFLAMLARENSDLLALSRLLPLHYYESGEAIKGLNLWWFGGLLGVAVLFTGLAWWAFERRDLRVSGEGSWRWPWARRQKAVP